MTTSSQPAGLGHYLARHGFAPNPGNTAWLDRDTGQQIIRVLCQPGETAWLYCLDPDRGCLYEVRFSPGIPDAVIIAVIEAASSSPLPAQARVGPGSPPTGGARTSEGVSRDDDR